MTDTHLDTRYRSRLIDALCELIAIPSCSHPRGGDEAAVQDYMARQMRAAGARVRTFEAGDVPGFSEHPLCCGPDRAYRNRPTVLGEIGPADAPALLVLAHSDTVCINNDPAQWRVTPPFIPRVLDGKVYGRGSGDDKWGLACILTILRMIADAGVEPTRRVIFASTIDEENGVGNGLLLLHLAGVRANAALYLDGTGSRLTIGNVGGSSLYLRAESKPPDTRIRALADACRRLSAERSRLFTGLFAENPARDCSIVSRLDADQFMVGFYTVPGEDGDQVLAAIEQSVRQALGPDGASFTASCRQPWFEPTTLPLDHPLVIRLVGVFRHTVGREPVVTTGWKQDSFVLRKFDVPTVSFGVSRDAGAGALHEPDEYIDLDEAWQGCRFAHRVVLDWLS